MADDILGTIKLLLQFVKPVRQWMVGSFVLCGMSEGWFDEANEDVRYGCRQGFLCETAGRQLVIDFS